MNRFLLAAAAASLSMTLAFAESPVTMPAESATTQPVTTQAAVDLDTPKMLAGKVFDAEIYKRVEAGARRAIAASQPAAPEVLWNGLTSLHTKDVSLPAAEAAEALAGDVIYDRSVDSVVVVARGWLCGKCDNVHVTPASGFVVGADGLIVTNFHVMKPPTGTLGFVVMTDKGRILPVTSVVAANQTDDCALIRVDVGAEPLKALPIAASSKVGETVYCLSHPDGRYWNFTTGIVSRKSFMGSAKRPRPILEITADYAQGSSGGAILNASGQLVGMVASTRSLYAEAKGPTTRGDLQMVMKQCVPIESIRALCEEK